jgi:outer membrane immunogenic protein
LEAIVKMRRSFAVALAFALLGACLVSPALAADLPYRTYTGPGPADFSGVEIGIDAAAALGTTGGATISGPAAGAHVGYNLQNGGLVGGAEADAIFGSIRTGSFGAGSFTQDFLSSARVKGGYAWGNMLAYGTFGWAFSTTSYQDPSGSSNKTIRGDVIGAGLEYALTRNVSVRGEYLFYDFAGATYTTPFTSKSLSTSTSLLRVGASLHF